MAAPAFYTRGGPGMADDRGESMVQKHTERLQKDKEEAAMGQLKLALPDVSPAVLALALQEVSWETDQAEQLLEQFLAVKGGQLAEVQKALQQGGARDGGAASPSASASDDESGGERKHKKRKSRKEKSKSKKRKHSDRADKGAASGHDAFGKYGVIRETDADRFRSEFVMWAAEVKKADVEGLPKWEEKELFKTFMEDYNTATLPHKKYYDLDVYERKRIMKAAKKGKTLGEEKADFNDEAEVAAARKREEAAAQQERLREAYNELKYTAPDKVEAMRDQEMTRMQMSLAYRTGDREKAEQLASRLKPDEPVWINGVLQQPKV